MNRLLLALPLLFSAAPAPVRMNEIQTIGTHNSYKVAIPPAEFAILSAHEGAESAAGLDYGHRPLEAQLDAGARTIEIDVYRDPQGGLYATPLLPRAAGVTLPADRRPGFKVFHVADVDVRSHCSEFMDCLAILKRWSDAHPRHVPILILINAKDDSTPAPGAVQVPKFDTSAFDALDAEIARVLGPDDLVTPDMVRGRHATLAESVAIEGWPALDRMRGRFFFALDESPEKVDLYRAGRRSLEGRRMFVNALPGDADAAYMTLNDPIGQAAEIRRALAAGVMVRTRADADTREARRGDTSRRDAALASGAQYVSTDYLFADPRFPIYSVALSGGGAARCNPVHPGACTAEVRLEP